MSWKVHVLMLVVGLGLLSMAQGLDSVTSAMLADIPTLREPDNRLRTVLQQFVGQAALLALVGCAAGLLVTGYQRWWPLGDRVSLRWKRRYGVLPPAEHRATWEKFAAFAFALLYAYAVALVVVPTTIAFLVVPDLYRHAPNGSPGASGAAETVEWGVFAAMALLTMTWLLLAARILWRDWKRLRRIEVSLAGGVPACFGCGYPLQGLESPVCPECGEDWRATYPAEQGRPVLPA